MNVTSHRLKGTICKGVGVAVISLQPYMNAIRQQTGLKNLVDGTLNLRLVNGTYVGHPDYIFQRGKYNPDEDTYFERCMVRGLPGLIMRTSTNFHGHSVLELMGEVRFRDQYALKDGDQLEIEVFAP